MNASSTGPATASPCEDWGVHVSAYVDLALDVVFDRLAPPSGAELLVAAIRAAIRAAVTDEGDVTVEATAAAPVWVSASHAHVAVTWSITASSGSLTEGEATISLLMVRSGRDAITELLVVVPTLELRTGRSNAVLHAVLYELAIRLETTPPEGSAGGGGGGGAERVEINEHSAVLDRGGVEPQPLST